MSNDVESLILILEAITMGSVETDEEEEREEEGKSNGEGEKKGKREGERREWRGRAPSQSQLDPLLPPPMPWRPHKYHLSLLPLILAPFIFFSLSHPFPLFF